MTRKPYPSDVSDDEWALVMPYLVLMDEDAPQRAYPLREIFNALRYLVRSGVSWRMLSNDLLPWLAVYQQTQRWLRAGVFEAMVDDLRRLIRLAEGREAAPSAAIIDRSALQSTPGFPSFSWLSRFRRLARDYERLATTLAGLFYLAFAILLAQRFVQLLNQGH